MTTYNNVKPRQPKRVVVPVKRKRNIVEEIKSTPKYNVEDANKAILELDDFYNLNKISDSEYQRYREEIISKIKSNEPQIVRQNPQYVNYSVETERKSRDYTEEEKRIKPEEKKVEESKKPIGESISDSLETYQQLKQSGILRLVSFVILAILLLFFVTKSGLSGISSSTILVFIIIFIIFFIIGKDSEKHFFDRF